MSDDLNRLNNLAIEQHIVVRGSMGFAEGSRGQFCKLASFPIKGIAVDAFTQTYSSYPEELHRVSRCLPSAGVNIHRFFCIMRWTFEA